MQYEFMILMLVLVVAGFIIYRLRTKDVSTHDEVTPQAPTPPHADPIPHHVVAGTSTVVTASQSVEPVGTEDTVTVTTTGYITEATNTIKLEKAAAKPARRAAKPKVAAVTESKPAAKKTAPTAKKPAVPATKRTASKKSQ